MNIELGRGIDGIDDLRDSLRVGFKIKFVMIQTTATIVKLFIGGVHADVASALLHQNAGSTFVGAGMIKKNLNVSWDSSSCEVKFDYDRPEENADEILAELKEAVRKLVGDEKFSA